MEELKEKRVEKQPLEYPSAGSTFKRPEGYFAGKLIMDAGLRGFQVGGAAVSEKHCGFVINKEKATASDVYRLIQEVQQEVYRQFGVKLETEVKWWGISDEISHCNRNVREQEKVRQSRSWKTWDITVLTIFRFLSRTVCRLYPTVRG